MDYLNLNSRKNTKADLIAYIKELRRHRDELYASNNELLDRARLAETIHFPDIYNKLAEELHATYDTAEIRLNTIIEQTETIAGLNTRINKQNNRLNEYADEIRQKDELLDEKGTERLIAALRKQAAADKQTCLDYERELGEAHEINWHFTQRAAKYNEGFGRINEWLDNVSSYAKFMIIVDFVLCLLALLVIAGFIPPVIVRP